LILAIGRLGLGIFLMKARVFKIVEEIWHSYDCFASGAARDDSPPISRIGKSTTTLEKSRPLDHRGHRV
jgi:hypothetical protein